TPSISNPSIPASPQSKYARSISAASTVASSSSRADPPASRNSIRRPTSRILRARSILRPKETRTISNRTPGRVADSHHTVLWYSSPDRDIELVIHRPLRPAVRKLPLQPRLRIVKLRNLRHHRRHVRPEQLPRLLPELQHHSDRRPLPGRLIQPL